jgi:hypothetical protein
LQIGWLAHAPKIIEIPMLVYPSSDDFKDDSGTTPLDDVYDVYMEGAGIKLTKYGLALGFLIIKTAKIPPSQHKS